MTLTRFVVPALALAACAGARDLPLDNTNPDGGSAGVAGLPCDVAKVLQDRCIACHQDPPLYNAPMALASYEDLVKVSPSTGEAYAVESVERMKATGALQMPPGGGLSAAEVATVENWVNAGAPKGSCGDVDVPDAGSTELPDHGNVCSSGTSWRRGESPTMRPGEACIRCHIAEGESRKNVGAMGTVYPSLHEPDDCNGLSGVTVEITDANGKVWTTTTNAAGNIYLSQTRTIPAPYRAKLKYQGRERAMLTPQTSGDCNSCHTQQGTENAPGRIVAP